MNVIQSATAFTLFLFLAFGISFAAYPSGLVSYWTFDSNANDALGLNNGTVSGAILNSTGGKVGGAYDFKVALNNINFNQSSSLDFASGSSFTYLGYFKSSYNATDQRILYKFNATEGSGYAVFLQSNCELWGVTWSAAKSNVTRASGVNYCDGQWHHLAFVRDQQNGLILLYVDGLVRNSTVELPRSLANSARLGFGIDYGFGSLYFNGSLDEMALFNRSLSASEISLYYNNSKDGVKNYFGDCRHACPAFGAGNLNNGSAVAATSVFANITLDTATQLRNFTFSWNGTNYSFYDSSLAGMWSFEEGALSDNFNSASISGSRWNVSPTASISVNRLMATTSTASWQNAGVTSKYPLSGDYDIQMDFDAGSWGTPTTQWNAFFGLNTPLDAVLCYYSKSSDGTKRYYSWDQAAGSSFGGSLNLADTSGKIRVTRVGNNVSCYYYNSGWILYATSVSSNFSGDTYVLLTTGNRDSGQSVTTYFDNFIVNKGQKFSDSSLYSNSATSNGTISSQQGQFGQYAVFSGAPSGTYITTLDNDRLDMFLRNVTLSAWFKFSQQQENYYNGTAYYGSIAGKGWLASVPDGGYGLFTVNDSISWQVRKDPVNTYLTSPLTYRDGQWHNAVGVLSRGSSPNLLLYIDGALVNSTTNSSIDNQNLNSTFGFDIGISEGTPGSYRFYFNGSLDEVRLYNRSLSALEVKQLYLSSLRKLNSTAWEFVTNQTNLSNGAYTYAGFATDTQGYTDTTGIRSVTLGYSPVISTYGGSTTNFATVPDLSNVTNLTLEKVGKGKIKFPPAYSVNAVGQDYDSQIIMDNGIISVNSSALDQSFNSTAILTVDTTGVYAGSSTPMIYYYPGFATNRSAIVQSGTACSAPRCTGITWNSTSNILTFNVTGFSSYGVNDSGLGGASNGTSTNNTATLGINITSTNQIAVYTSNGLNDSTFSFVPVTPPAAGSVTLMSNEVSNTTGGELGFLVENQGNVNVSITVASDKNAAAFIGGSTPLFQMFGGANESGSCAGTGLNTSMQDLGASAITVCPSLAYPDTADTIWAYVLVRINSDSPPQTNTATLTFTSTQV